MSDTPDTIFLIHGLWMTPLCWEHWVERYTSRGYTVQAPTWPHMDAPIEELRRDPSAMGGMGVTEIVDHYEKIIRELDSPPIIMGHSFGGLFVQKLLDRGVASAGVAIHPAPPKGVFRLPLPVLKSGFPVLGNPLNRNRAVPLTPKQFHYGFTNSLSEAESKTVYDRYHVPGTGRVIFQAAFANLNPRAATRVNFRNNDRAPLLLVAGDKDHTVAASMVKENAKRQSKSKATTAYKEFTGRTHFTLGQEGWEEVADFALAWVTANSPTAPRDLAAAAGRSA